ncbi:hypothetical protein EI427_16730 [Flammeovirga pectinis]|uniref:Uncharacterized protein n=1 Tax=Flammeovirga pectinis TaxID=2494373 RepID=A0A3Q9FSP6_9BACT|nr:hypothetical protein [Flammeovirga pectinis]AZQ63810.1 hypothetical protein EI427_16730 [Flammeovirga pectinis]
MNILDKFRLTKNIEIKLDLNSIEFYDRLLLFKNSKTELFGFLTSNGFVPSELTLMSNEFEIYKMPRIFKPWRSVGYIKGKIIETNDKTLIKARIHSWYFWLLILVIFMTVLYSIVLLTMTEQSIIAKALWFLLFQILNVLYFFLLRSHVEQLDKEFRMFLSKIVR